MKRKKVEWNKVTWYSKLIAAVVVVGIFFCMYEIGLLVGATKQSLSDQMSFLSNAPAPIVHNGREPFPPVLDSCSSATSQVDLNICEHQAYETADDELNTLYQSILSSVAVDYRFQVDSDFMSAESDWLAYRNSACQSEAETESGGSMEAATLDACLASLTEQRIAYLNSVSNEF